VILVPFTTVCPFCARSFRLLDRFRDRKIMCMECRKPFIAVNARSETLEVTDGREVLPEAGWLLVCPSCGHTEVVAEEGERRTHCSQCSTALGDPRTGSKKIRKRDEPS
jgi:ribosomal protein S27E